MRWREWLGVGERRWKKAPDEEVQPAKTLWDWLQLLIVPAILVAVTFAWSATQTRSDNKREDRRIAADNKREDRRIAADRAAAEEARKDGTLQGYLDQMSGLMLHEGLLTSKQGSAAIAVRAVACTVTLATLRRLDGERKAQVVRFLYEAQLMDGGNPRVSLVDADLGGAFLRGADLTGANLTGANLRGANLGNADLGSADLGRAHLEGARLDGADLEIANLGNAGLRGANLTGADLFGADLGDVNFEGADLKGADLDDADLGGADLAGAEHLDLGRFIGDLSPEGQRDFLDSRKAFFDSLSRKDLAKFNLSPEKLARFRREADGG